MSKYDEAARIFAETIQSSETARREGWQDLGDLEEGYSKANESAATVRTLHTLFTAVSHLSSLNTQVQTVRRLLWLIAAMLFVLVLKALV
jgi:hypothetical protein